MEKLAVFALTTKALQLLKESQTPVAAPVESDAIPTKSNVPLDSDEAVSDKLVGSAVTAAAALLKDKPKVAPQLEMQSGHRFPRMVQIEKQILKCGKAETAAADKLAKEKEKKEKAVLAAQRKLDREESAKQEAKRKLEREEKSKKTKQSVSKPLKAKPGEFFSSTLFPKLTVGSL